MSDSDRTWSGVTLKPLDVLFFRDGRPFDAANRVEGGLPNPQTLSGALRTGMLSHSGFRFDQFGKKRKGMETRKALEAVDPNLGWIYDARFRGPWLARKTEATDLELLLPVPATLTADVELDTEKKEHVAQWYRQRPLPEDALPFWKEMSALPLPLWQKENASRAKTPQGFLTLNGIRRFLEGGLPEKGDFCSSSELFDHDHRIGIAIDGQTLTSAEGQLYGIRLLALKPDVFLYAEISAGEGAPERDSWLPQMLPFGGEGKYVESTIQDAIAWPQGETNSKGLYLLATPGFVEQGKAWPSGVSKGLQAAASREPLAVSGWDIARNGPLATRFAAPAGSVYYVNEEHQLNNNSLCTDDEQVAQGWGFALRGKWNDE